MQCWAMNVLNIVGWIGGFVVPLFLEGECGVIGEACPDSLRILRTQRWGYEEIFKRTTKVHFGYV